jgi:hypothetical protein
MAIYVIFPVFGNDHGSEFDTVTTLILAISNDAPGEVLELLRVSQDDFLSS